MSQSLRNTNYKVRNGHGHVGSDLSFGDDLRYLLTFWLIFLFELLIFWKNHINDRSNHLINDIGYQALTSDSELSSK